MNPNDPLRFAKYEADLTAANLRIKQLEEANQAERYAKSEAEANRLLDTLDMAGYCFNRQRELKALIPLAPADRHAHIDELRQYSKRDENRIIVHGHIETGPEPAAVGPRTIDEFNAIRSKAAANGKSVAEAMAANFTN